MLDHLSARLPLGTRGCRHPTTGWPAVGIPSCKDRIPQRKTFRATARGPEGTHPRGVASAFPSRVLHRRSLGRAMAPHGSRAIVEELVRLHDFEFHSNLQPQQTVPVQQARWVLPLALHTRLHCESAGRTAIAACCSCVCAKLWQQDFPPLIAIFAILCSAPTLGETTRCCMEATLGTLIAVLLGWLALALSIVASAQPPDDTSISARAVLAIAGLVLLNLLVASIFELPTVLRKVLGAMSSVGVLVTLTEPQAPPVSRPPAAMVGVAIAVLQGVVCALAGALLPAPRLAARRADKTLQAAAAGVAMLLASQLQSLPRGRAENGDGRRDAARAGTPPSSSGRRERMQTQRILRATHKELATLPAICDAAHWESCGLWHACRRRHRWRQCQLLALKKASSDLNVLSEALPAVRSMAVSSVASQLLALLAPELDALCECARLASQAFGRPPSVEADLSHQCREALARFDEAFLSARVALIWRAEGDGASTSVPSAGASTAASAAGSEPTSDSPRRQLSGAVERTGEIVTVEAVLFALTRFTARISEVAAVGGHGGGESVGDRQVASRGGMEWRPLLRSACSGTVARWQAAATRARDNARVSLALLLSCLLATRFERGFWAAATVVFVLDPGMGASVRNCAMRLQGSVIGACYGFVSLTLAARLPHPLHRDWLLIAAFTLWTFVCAFVRAASTHSYAGFVAAFTPAVMLLGAECGSIGSVALSANATLACERFDAAVSSLAMERIQFTLAGIVCALGASLVAFPVDAPSRLHEQLGESLVCLRRAFEHTAGEWTARATAMPMCRDSCVGSRLRDAAEDAPPSESVVEMTPAVCRGSDQIGASPPSQRAEPHVPPPISLEGEAAALPGIDHGSLALTESPVNGISSPVDGISSPVNGISSPVNGVHSSRTQAATTLLRNADCISSSRTGNTVPRRHRVRPTFSDDACTDWNPVHDELYRQASAALAALPPLIEEAAHSGGCWRHAYPAESAHKLCEAFASMLDALNLMEDTLGALRPGGVWLIEPLLKPINRVETQVVLTLRALLQQLRAGSDGSVQPCSSASPALRLFAECYAECLQAIISSSRQAFSDVHGAAPSLTNEEVLTFNALVFSIKSLILHMERASERMSELLALLAPIDLASVRFV